MQDTIALPYGGGHAATAARLGVELERLGGEVRALRLGLLGIKGGE